MRFCLTVCCLLFVASPAMAMINTSELPPVGDCGLPADGNVAHQITCTLTSDCPTDGDLHVTHGVTVTIDSNGFCFKIRIEDGEVTVIGEDGAGTTCTSGTVSTCSSGQTLVIRDATTFADCDQIVHVVSPGDTLFTIAEAYDVPPRHLAIRNQIPYGGNRLFSGQQLVIPDVTSLSVDCGAAGQARHVVHPGHTLYSIALVYGVSLDDLIRLNRLTNEGHTLYCGQVLIIPYVSW